MRPNETFVGQPIRSLQQMLRTIAQTREDQLSVIPDGIYGPDTIRAVSNFQRRNGLPVTGMTDLATWEQVYLEYETAVIAVTEATPIRVNLGPNQVIRAGEQDYALYLCQAMLLCLSDAYGAITPPAMTGILDLPTRESLICFQELCDLPATGELDRITWYHLANQYPLAARVGAGSVHDRGSIRK